MDNSMLEKCAGDVRLIKEIIEKTSSSFISFGRVFIYWALLFSGINGLSFSVERLTGWFTVYPWLNYGLLPLFLVLAVLVAFKVLKDMPLRGLSKQLMMIWLYLLLLNFLVTVVNQAMPEMLLVSFSIGLLCTSIFTNFRFPGWLALIYLAVGVAYSISPFATAVILSWIYPATFLILGVYLLKKQTHRSI